MPLVLFFSSAPHRQQSGKIRGFSDGALADRPACLEGPNGSFTPSRIIQESQPSQKNNSNVRVNAFDLLCLPICSLPTQLDVPPT